jgi:indolepyruvate ferredoxin oxidoreductase
VLNSTVSLDDRWNLERGRVVISGVQAIGRVLLMQAVQDRRNGLNTAGYITGYRGSPLGNVDTMLWSISNALEAANIRFQPGVNEDIAATAIRGTQQIESVPGAKYDGVFAAWYGKGPGVDRSGDAFKHGNYVGAHRHGGVLVFYGDDHAGKSSTVAHQSEQAMSASLIPSLYPSNAQELLDYGLIGIALSRYSGSWVGVKCVNEVVEQSATIDLDPERASTLAPTMPEGQAAEVHVRNGAFDPLLEEQIVIERRLPLIQAFLRVNRIDRTIIEAAERRLGIVTAGKTYGDVRSALARLGLDEATAAAAGISLYKVGCIWPLEPHGIKTFAEGHETLLVIEEKKSFLEQQIAAILINEPERPRLIGKIDEDGGNLLSAAVPLEPDLIARVIVERLRRLGINKVLGRLSANEASAIVEAKEVLPKRSPYFCSGCPHNRSTRIPEGSFSMTGIGCHTMANFVRPHEALLPAQMGAEGGSWIGIAPFTETPHIFQNMGDGTYYHSGLLAIRAAVAAGVNITYKLLYNDAVAMTGGQPVDGPISVAEMANQVQAEGVRRIVLLSDAPEQYDDRTVFPANITIGHRDDLDRVQRELRETPGCTVLIYEQTCAAEKRRRRKRGSFPDPAKRLFISQAVCEGCGDCSVQSTCVSLTPVETEWGRKRKIDQSSCNKDYSCLNGFCPSFITVYGAEPRRPKGTTFDEGQWAKLPTPPRAPIKHNSYNLMITGIGGTGVVTVGAIIGMAAHLDGMAMSSFDMTGLSQKNGAVYSHLRIATHPDALHAQRLAAGESDLLLAFDLVAALAPEASATVASDRTRAIVNADMSPTVAFQFDRNSTLDPKRLIALLQRKTMPDAITVADASSLALDILGDTIGANLFLVGIAAQQGLLPVSIEALRRAIEMNGVAVSFNLRALALGRLFVSDPGAVIQLAEQGVAPPPALTETLEELITHRSAHLQAYQNAALAQRYEAFVSTVRAREESVMTGTTALTQAVARNYAKLLSYKDEYEVARLLTMPALREEISRTFADGARIAFNLAPPVLARPGNNGRPTKREFPAGAMLPLMSVLSRFKFVRGTRFDPFGYTSERRMERQLIRDYEALVERVLDVLSPKNHSRALALLGQIDEVRGFGPVKEAAAQAYRRDIKIAEAEFHASPLIINESPNILEPLS